jgi:hypothetical protein
MGFKTTVLLVILGCGGYFAWERYSSAPEGGSPSPMTSGGSPSPITSAVLEQVTKLASPTPQYTEVVRYMTADGQFGLTDDQAKVPAGAKILGIEKREVHTDQGSLKPDPAGNGTAATRLPAYRRDQGVRSGRASLMQLEQEQAALKAQRDAEDSASSSSPSQSSRAPCHQTPGSPHELYCDPSRSRSVDELTRP